MSSQKEDVKFCILLNGAIMLAIAVGLSCFSSHIGYFRWGPHSDLIIIGITIDNWFKYTVLQIVIAIIEISNVYTSEKAMPVLGFSVYNPDKKEITEFSSMYELQIYANSMFMIQSIKNVMLVVLSITQIDIALLKVLYGELTSFYTIRILLSDKTFPNEYEKVDTSSELEMV
jgi:hypothetical protein